MKYLDFFLRAPGGDPVDGFFLTAKVNEATDSRERNSLCGPCGHGPRQVLIFARVETGVVDFVNDLFEDPGAIAALKMDIDFSKRFQRCTICGGTVVK